MNRTYEYSHHNRQASKDRISQYTRDMRKLLGSQLTGKNEELYVVNATGIYDYKCIIKNDRP